MGNQSCDRAIISMGHKPLRDSSTECLLNVGTHGNINTPSKWGIHFVQRCLHSKNVLHYCIVFHLHIYNTCISSTYVLHLYLNWTVSILKPHLYYSVCTLTASVLLCLYLNCIYTTILVSRPFTSCECFPVIYQIITMFGTLISYECLPSHL